MKSPMQVQISFMECSVTGKRGGQEFDIYLLRARLFGIESLSQRHRRAMGIHLPHRAPSHGASLQQYASASDDRSAHEVWHP